jgi:hypothetical protein
MKKSERVAHFCVISSQMLQGDGANLMETIIAGIFREKAVRNPNREG